MFWGIVASTVSLGYLFRCGIDGSIRICSTLLDNQSFPKYCANTCSHQTCLQFLIALYLHEYLVFSDF